MRSPEHPARRAAPAELAWLLARPVAHRGLHDAGAGIIENTPSAVSAAVAAGYAIEVDLQITADGEAVVYHDAALGRLTDGTERLARLTAGELKRIAFKATADRMMTLGELCELVAGRSTLFLELKSHHDGDPRLPLRVREILRQYRGAAAVMSFDPQQLWVLRSATASIVCGIVAEPARHSLGYFYRLLRVAPQFVAYPVWGLPALMPGVARRLCGVPLLAWTVRGESDRKRASRFADQIIFEGFRPEPAPSWGTGSRARRCP